MIPAFNPFVVTVRVLYELSNAGCPIFGDGGKYNKRPWLCNLWYIGS
jgi:hypothetical protein